MIKFAVIVVLFFCCAAVNKNQGNAGQFEKLKLQVQEFRRKPALQDRDGYLALVKNFQHYAQHFSSSPNAPIAIFFAGRLLEEWAHKSKQATDYQTALKSYLRFSNNFPSHDNTDEALYRAARLYATRLEDKPAAIKLLQQILSRNNVSGEYYGHARRQLAVIVNHQRQILAIKKNQQDNAQTIDIILDGEASFSQGELAAFGKYPRRFYVDIKPARLEKNYQESFAGFGVKKVRYGQFNSDIARVVFELDEDASYQMSAANPSNKISVTFSKKGVVQATKKVAAKEPKAPVINFVTPRQSGFKIVLDPGHGGTDPGAVGPNNVKEKDVTLAIAQRIAKKITKDLPEIKVFMTRSTDKTLSLSERTDFANKIGADLFISIHANAAPNRSTEGIETYYLDITADRYAIRLAARENEVSEAQISDLEYILADLAMKSNTQQSINLGTSVQKNILGKVRSNWSDVKDLGLKYALFYVLIGAKMPAILIEASFISNPKEEKRLIDQEYQDSIAQGVVLGIHRYLSNTVASKRP